MPRLRAGGAVVGKFRQSHSVVSAGSLSNEDEWYDSEKWESFSKSKARVTNPRADESKRGEESTSISESEGPIGEEKNSNKDVEWLRLVGCDICLPKDRRKSLDDPRRFEVIVHFVGGVFAGSIPGQAYRPLLEDLTSKGRFITIATPCAALSGMDHLKAAYEAALKFNSACRALEAELGADVLRADEVPHIGMGHSLGCKVHVVLSAIPDCRRAAGRRRAANVFLAYNNYGAKESVPVLSELADAQRALRRGAAAAAPALGELSSNLRAAVEGVPALRNALGSRAEALLDVLGKVETFAQGVASAPEEPSMDEFSPSPAETERLLAADYPVSRNLVVKFLDDAIDQSIPLCTALRARFTAPDTGAGGRLDLRRLPGTHVTPNTPRIDDASLQEGPIRELAQEKQRELQALVDTVAAFISVEAAAAALTAPDGGADDRLGPAAAPASTSESPPQSR